MLGRYQHLKGSFLGMPSAKDKEVVQHCLEVTGLTAIRSKKLNELSGGQLQRVFLAHILAQEPDIILLDEPTNHLDIKYQLELMTYLKEWSKQKDHMVIGVFHDLNLALYLSENVLFLKDGHVAGKGKAKDLISRSFLQDIFEVDMMNYMLTSLEKWKKFNENQGFNKSV